MGQYDTACGGIIKISKQTERHMAAHPNVLEHLEVAIGKLQLPVVPKKIECEIDLIKTIGRSGLVRTLPLELDNSAMFAIRKNRNFPSRVVAEGELGEETSKIVVIARPSLVEQEYDLITAWVGTLARKEPWDSSILKQDEFQDCLNFWRSAALVYDPDTMGPVFESSWRDVLSRSRSRFNLTDFGCVSVPSSGTFKT